MTGHEHPLLPSLRDEAGKLREQAQGSTGEALSAILRELANVEEHIAKLEAGTPACRNCGSTSIRAWYPVDTAQGIDIERAADGSLTYDYDGDEESGESGADTEYWCRECDYSANTLEYLVGDTDDDGAEPEHPTIEALQMSCGYDPDTEGSVDALIAYKDALEDAYASLLEGVSHA